MQLQLVTRTWLQECPAFEAFGGNYKNGNARKGAVEDFLSMLIPLGLLTVDDRNRPFLDTEDPVWLRLTADAEKRLKKGAVTRENVARSGDRQARLARIGAASRRAAARRGNIGG